MEMSIKKNFNTFELLLFSFPSMINMMFVSLYQSVDGLFISNLVGTDALSAVNIVYPFISVIIGIGIMLGTGGSAIIGINLGMNNDDEARKNFTRIVVLGLIVSTVISIFGYIFMDEILHLLGANERLMPYCVDYYKIQIWFMPAMIVQIMFSNFFITASMPGVGLFLSTATGVTNAVLDYVFIKIFHMGIAGASLATVTGYLIPCVFALVYFTFVRKGDLYFVKSDFCLDTILKTCGNGSSELISNLAVSVTTLLINYTMLKLVGEDGVAAFTVVLYTQFLFTSIFMGFSEGVAPVISYNYGSQNREQFDRITKICKNTIGYMSVLMILSAFIFAKQVVGIFIPADSSAYDITLLGYKIFSVNYIFAGFNIYASNFFTAISNGKVSALISSLRTFVFTVLGLVTLPYLFENGIWFAIPIAEMVTLVVSIYFLRKPVIFLHNLNAD